MTSDSEISIIEKGHWDNSFSKTRIFEFVEDEPPHEINDWVDHNQNTNFTHILYDKIEDMHVVYFFNRKKSGIYELTNLLDDILKMVFEYANERDFAKSCPVEICNNIVNYGDPEYIKTHQNIPDNYCSCDNTNFDLFNSDISITSSMCYICNKICRDKTRLFSPNCRVCSVCYDFHNIVHGTFTGHIMKITMDDYVDDKGNVTNHNNVVVHSVSQNINSKTDMILGSSNDLFGIGIICPLCVRTIKCRKCDSCNEIARYGISGTNKIYCIKCFYFWRTYKRQYSDRCLYALS